MTEDPVVDRALQIARTSNCTTVVQIRNQLAREGYSAGDDGMASVALTGHLRSLMLERRRRLGNR